MPIGEPVMGFYVRLNTTRAMRLMGKAVLWIFGAIVFSVVTVFVPIPFGLFGALAVFSAGITLMIATPFERMTAEDRVR